jgi:hypothetical protein
MPRDRKRCAIHDAVGNAIPPSTKAIGHAIKADLSHDDSQSASVRDIIPDIVVAIMNVMMTWVRIIVVLSIGRSFNDGRCLLSLCKHRGTILLQGWCRGITPIGRA